MNAFPTNYAPNMKKFRLIQLQWVPCLQFQTYYEFLMLNLVSL